MVDCIKQKEIKLSKKITMAAPHNFWFSLFVSKKT
jgi:hypothetical protein